MAFAIQHQLTFKQPSNGSRIALNRSWIIVAACWVMACTHYDCLLKRLYILYTDFNF